MYIEPSVALSRLSVAVCAWMEVRSGGLGDLERARATGVRSETAGVCTAVAYTVGVSARSNPHALWDVAGNRNWGPATRERVCCRERLGAQYWYAMFGWVVLGLNALVRCPCARTR